MRLRHLGDAVEIDHLSGRVHDGLDHDRACALSDRGGDALWRRFGEGTFDVEPLVEAFHQAKRAAEHLARAHILLARGAKREQRHEPGGLSGGDRHAGGAAFERGDTPLERGDRRIRAARVGETLSAHREDIGAMRLILEDEAVGLEDRHGPRAGRRVGLSAAVYGACRERKRGWAGHEGPPAPSRRGPANGPDRPKAKPQFTRAKDQFLPPNQRFPARSSRTTGENSSPNGGEIWQFHLLPPN